LPEVTLRLASVGDASTVNTLPAAAVDIPPDVVTITFCGPSAAPPETANVAVSEVALVTVTFDAVMPAPLKLSVVCPAPITKFVPVIVSLMVAAPCAPIGTLSAVTVGAGGITLNCTTFAVVRPSVVTNTVCNPVEAFAAIVNVAVIVVVLVTITLLVVMPVPLKLMVAGAKKFVPVSVMLFTVAPTLPLVVLSEVSVGGGSTVNCTTLEVVTPSVVTKTVCGPVGAPPAIMNVVVIDVGLATVTAPVVMPVPLKLTVAGVKKLVPVSVIVPVVVPWALIVWLSEVSVGAGSTVKGFVLEVPPGAVTEMLLAPRVAPAETANVAVICVGLTIIRFDTVMPAGALMVTGATKFVPVSVSLIEAAPCAPMVTLSEVSVGAGGFTVN